MIEWKELKIDDLPSDILVGDYEFKVSSKRNNFVVKKHDFGEAIRKANGIDNYLKNISGLIGRESAEIPPENE